MATDPQLLPPSSVGKKLQASTSAPSVSNHSRPGSTTTTTNSSISQGNNDPDKTIVIGSFKERLKKIKEARASKLSSRISPFKFEDLTREMTVEAKLSVTIAEEGSSLSSVPPPSLVSLQEKTLSSSLEGSPPMNLKVDSADNQLSNNTDIKEVVFMFTDGDYVSDPSSAFNGDMEKVSMGRDSSDDELPSIPPPPVPDLPPPDAMDFPPSPGDDMEDDTSAMETKPALNIGEKLSGQHSSTFTRQQKEVWKQKSDVLEGAMSDPLPLFIQSKANIDNFKTSSESISSIPDFPPPTVPDSPPPMMLLEDSDEMIDVLVLELPAKDNSPSQVNSSGPATTNSEQLRSPSSDSHVFPSQPRSHTPSPPESLHHPESTPPMLPKPDTPMSPQTLPESLPPSIPETMPPELPSSPLPTISDSEQNSFSPHTAELVATSTPLSQASGLSPTEDQVTKASLVLCKTPVPMSAEQSMDPSLSSALSSSNSIGIAKSDSLSSSVARDDMKSTSVPNIEPTTNTYSAQNGIGVHLRMDKQFHPAHHRQSLPLSTERRFDTDAIRVISHGSPPASPDLKFTRIAKRTWKGVTDDLSSSASTGNVIDSIDIHELVGLKTGSLRSLQSNDSFDKGSFLQKNLKMLALSPLVAISTSTPRDTTVKSPEKVSPVSGKKNSEVHSSPFLAGSDSTSGSTENVLPREQQLKKHPLKLGQLDIVRGVTARATNSPMSSFILDSNLLDVSYTYISIKYL